MSTDNVTYVVDGAVVLVWDSWDTLVNFRCQSLCVVLRITIQRSYYLKVMYAIPSFPQQALQYIFGFSNSRSLTPIKCFPFKWTVAIYVCILDGSVPSVALIIRLLVLLDVYFVWCPLSVPRQCCIEVYSFRWMQFVQLEQLYNVLRHVIITLVLLIIICTWHYVTIKAITTIRSTHPRLHRGRWASRSRC